MSGRTAPAAPISRAKVVVWWRNTRDSLWLLPSLMVAVASTAALLLIAVDRSLEDQGRTAWYLFGGTPDGARELLSVVAGSLITVVAVTFSVTMLAIQQAATQYTPRVLRNFTRDRGNQVVLGTYIGTFTYSLLVLREVRSSSDSLEAFVPAVSTFGAFVLAMVSLGMLVYFVHHAAETLQVSYVLQAIRNDLDGEIDQLFPDPFGRDAAEPPDGATAIAAFLAAAGDALPIRSEDEGYLSRIDLHALERAVPRNAMRVVVPVRTGTWLQRGDLLALVWCDHAREHELTEAIRGAFGLDLHRTVDQDAMFGVRQLADIALKALSPGINDPTTAEEALNHLGGALGHLMGRRLPSPERTEGNTTWWFARPDMGDYVREAFGQILRAAQPHPHVLASLAAVLSRLADRAPSAARRRLVRELQDDLLARMPGDLTRAESDAILTAGRRAPISSRGGAAEAPDEP